MKAMYRKYKIAAAIATGVLAALLLSSCSYQELTPKTDDRSDNYQLPKGETPTAAERALVQAAKDEYNAAISKK